jgi:hypothetical protein
MGAPAVGGIALGLVLLALPEMYGVGYPVMDRVINGHVVLALIVLFMLGKILACSLTLSIGGSGGVFAPSLFIGAMAGMAFGTIAQHIFGHAVGLACDLCARRDGRRLRRRDTSTAHGDRKRRRDDRQLHAHASRSCSPPPSLQPCLSSLATATSTPPNY